MNLEELYQYIIDNPTQPNISDIVEHLPTLKDLASECEHVTEMGFRVGTSFVALLMGKPKRAITYDTQIPQSCVDGILPFTKDTQCVFHEKSTLDVEIEETDFLFIDTLHTHKQLDQELKLHGNKVKKYLAFHDTVTYGLKGEDGTQPGLMRAIMDFITTNPRWKI